MLAIVRAIERKRIKGAKVAVVISDKREAKALETAERHGLDAAWLDPEEAPSRLAYDMRLLDVLKDKGVTPEGGLVLLAGFMRLLSPEFVDAFRGRIMNVHPSLLPSFPGLRAQEQALERGVKVSGCTVHFVVPEVDSGPSSSRGRSRSRTGTRRRPSRRGYSGRSTSSTPSRSSSSSREG